MKNLKFKPITIIILIVAFLLVVGLLAAIAGLSARSKRQNANQNAVITMPENNNTNTLPSEEPSTEPTTDPDNTTNTIGNGGAKSGGFDDFRDNIDLESYFSEMEIDSIVTYSAAGTNMVELKDEFEVDMFYKEEIKGDDLEELVDNLKEVLVSSNAKQYAGDNKKVLKELFANKYVVVDDDFYFGINADNIYAFNGVDIEVFEINDYLSEFATNMPEEVSTSFKTFTLFLDQDGDELEINFDDKNEVKGLKEKLKSYEAEDLDTDDLEHVGRIEFDNNSVLELYNGDYCLGEYKSGRSVETVFISNDFIESLLEIVEEALN